MAERAIYITDYDMQRLRKLLEDARSVEDRRREDLKALKLELDRARRVAPEDVPPDVITMNSRVRLIDEDTGEEMVYTLVFPGDANMREDKISVLAPIGTGMLGYRVGDTFTWMVPDGERRLSVAEILYQPEAAGEYQL